MDRGARRPVQAVEEQATSAGDALLRMLAGESNEDGPSFEDLVAAGRKAGRDVSEGATVLNDIRRFFSSNTHWSQNDAWYLELRDRMARAIVLIKRKP